MQRFDWQAAYINQDPVQMFSYVQLARVFFSVKVID